VESCDTFWADGKRVALEMGRAFCYDPHSFSFVQTGVTSLFSNDVGHPLHVGALRVAAEATGSWDIRIIPS
jgi:hypothetical protein